MSTKTTGFEKLAVVDIQMETTSGQTINLPMYLHLSVHEKEILSALTEANADIEVEREELQNNTPEPIGAKRASGSA